MAPPLTKRCTLTLPVINDPEKPETVAVLVMSEFKVSKPLALSTQLEVGPIILRVPLLRTEKAPLFIVLALAPLNDTVLKTVPLPLPPSNVWAVLVLLKRTGVAVRSI